jgi:hypothetical protein
MTENINKIVSVLVGLQLSRQTRAGRMQCFQFGKLTVIDDKKAFGEFALHVQSPWRLTNTNEILVGSSDLYKQADENAEDDPDFDWDKLNANLRDVKLEKLFSENKCVVVSANADKYGGLVINFDNHVSLTVFPDLSSKTENEYWRLIDKRLAKATHYESWSTGYEVG